MIVSEILYCLCPCRILSVDKQVHLVSRAADLVTFVNTKFTEASPFTKLDLKNNPAACPWMRIKSLSLTGWLMDDVRVGRHWLR